MSRLVAPGLSIPSLGASLGGPGRSGQPRPFPPDPPRLCVSEPVRTVKAREDASQDDLDHLQGFRAQRDQRRSEIERISTRQGRYSMPSQADSKASLDGLSLSGESDDQFEVVRNPPKSHRARLAHDSQRTDGLGVALSTFGPPSEWWHDSVIVGRLSALAMRYFATKAVQKPWRCWLFYVHNARKKAELCLRSQMILALRRWHRASVRDGRRLRNKLPLIRALRKVFAGNVAPAWTRYRQAVFMQRDVDRRLKLLHIVRWKMMNTMAQVHYCHALLRVGMASLWLATKTKDVACLPTPASSPEATSSFAAKSHVQQV
ncbi:unnamed protein product, partial [Durusdinium trenchii]